MPTQRSKFDTKLLSRELNVNASINIYICKYKYINIINIYNI